MAWWKMSTYKQILEFIDIISYMLSDYLLNQVKTTASLKIISQIIDHSNKEVSEAVLAFLAAARYLLDDRKAFLQLEETDSMQEYIKKNSDSIIKLAVEKSVQANFPERALPLFEVFEKKIEASSISVIELGASYGLIGRCLLNPKKIVEKKDLYFSKEQQLPKNPRAIDYYLGIELDPPDERWIFACAPQPDHELRLRNIVNGLPADKKFELLKGNAFGFSELESVKRLTLQPTTIVVLTSFMLYQYDNKKQTLIKDEILRFTDDVNGHWVSLTFNPASDEFIVEFAGERIIKLPDDHCISWKWIE